MFKFLIVQIVLLAFFATFVLTFPSGNVIVTAPSNGRQRVVLQGEEFKGRHVCAADNVCECWYYWYEDDYFVLTVDCGHRNLPELPKNLSGIRVDELNLDGNDLEHAPDMTKDGFESVRYLDLNSNRIKSISEKIISPKLEGLDLNYNQIARIDVKVFRKLRSLDRQLMSITLKHNPLICDCESRDTLQILQSMGYVFGPDSATCATTNKRIFEMNFDKICLQEEFRRTERRSCSG